MPELGAMERDRPAVALTLAQRRLPRAPLGPTLGAPVPGALTVLPLGLELRQGGEGFETRRPGPSSPFVRTATKDPALRFPTAQGLLFLVGSLQTALLIPVIVRRFREGPRLGRERRSPEASGGLFMNAAAVISGWPRGGPAGQAEWDPLVPSAVRSTAFRGAGDGAWTGGHPGDRTPRTRAMSFMNNPA